MRRHVINDAAQFGRVAVLLGGTSSEREVSLDSGQGVYEALLQRGVDAQPVDGIPALLEALQAQRFDRVFNILHGNRGGGEDGVLQGALDAIGVPYTGSGVLGSALSMNKALSKRVWQALGLPTPDFVTLRPGEDIGLAAEKIGFPLIVKPANEGSSVGVSWVYSEADLNAAYALAAHYPGDLLVERLIEGDELTVSILQGQSLPSIRIEPVGERYDYTAKYVSDATQYICPGLDEPHETALGELALKAFAALECAGWGRVDIMRDAHGNNWLLEVNTAPGMTSHSLVPKSAHKAGMDYAELCWRVLETSMQEASR